MARLGLLWRRGRRCRWRGRHGTWRHGPSLCVAGVALRAMDRHFAWQAWHLWHWAGSGGALGSPLAPWSPPPFAWQAWYLATCTRHFAWKSWHFATWIVTLRGRRGTYSTGLAPVARATFTHYCIHSFYAPPFDIHLLHTPILHHLFSLSLHFPSHLYLSFAAYWKKLTCGVIRSFNFCFGVEIRFGTAIFQRRGA